MGWIILGQGERWSCVLQDVYSIYNFYPVDAHSTPPIAMTKNVSRHCQICPVCLIIQPCPTLCNPMDYSLPGSSVHGILQARILEWVAISSSRGFSWPRDQTSVSSVSCIAGWFFTCWAIARGQNVLIENQGSLGSTLLALGWQKLFCH